MAHEFLAQFAVTYYPHLKPEWLSPSPLYPLKGLYCLKAFIRHYHHYQNSNGCYCFQVSPNRSIKSPIVTHPEEKHIHKLQFLPRFLPLDSTLHEAPTGNFKNNLPSSGTGCEYLYFFMFFLHLFYYLAFLMRLS